MQDSQITVIIWTGIIIGVLLLRPFVWWYFGFYDLINYQKKIIESLEKLIELKEFDNVKESKK